MSRGCKTVYKKVLDSFGTIFGSQRRKKNIIDYLRSYIMGQGGLSDSNQDVCQTIIKMKEIWFALICIAMF